MALASVRGPHFFGQLLAQRCEVVRADVGNKPMFSKIVGDEIASCLVIIPRSRGDFAGVPGCGLGVQEGVDEFFDRERAAFGPALSADVQGVLLIEILGESSVGIVPRAEVVKLATDFFRPSLGCMGEQREFGIGLVGLATGGGRGRIALRGDTPS